MLVRLIQEHAHHTRTRFLLKSLTTQLDITLLTHDDKYVAIDSICPHANGPVYQGDIEDSVIICPYHEYRFDLGSGRGEMHDFVLGIYDVKVSDGWVHVIVPDLPDLVRVEIIAIPPPCIKKLENAMSDSIEFDARPGSLVEWAIRILNTPDPELKVSRTNQASELWLSNSIPARPGIPIKPPSQPPRSDILTIVGSNQIKRRGKAGSVSSRIAILHSLANIEQWAIDLAWDMIARFHTEMPNEFLTDFVRVAKEEAKHFSLLNARLHELDSYFGAMPVHNSLWESATVTAGDVLARLAIVHMVHESRGLDVNPRTIDKFVNAGDLESGRILSIIHREEIGHVSIGHRWFTHVCERSELVPLDTFHEIVPLYFNGALKPPFNQVDRDAAGLSEEWYLPISR